MSRPVGPASSNIFPTPYLQRQLLGLDRISTEESWVQCKLSTSVTCSSLIVRFQLCRLEGTMSPQARDATIKFFSASYPTLSFLHLPRFLVNNVDVTVFLVSLKAGGVALNLTEASRVYLMDSWWYVGLGLPSIPCLVPTSPFLACICSWGLTKG